MNSFKKNASQEFVNCEEAISLIEKIDSHNSLYMLHETHYPETRKDICLVKKTFVGVQGSFDSIYLVWRHNNDLNVKKIWSTSIYDPPGERNLLIGYIYEDARKLLIKIYPASEFGNKPSAYPGVVHELNKEKLGIKN